MSTRLSLSLFLAALIAAPFAGAAGPSTTPSAKKDGKITVQNDSGEHVDVWIGAAKVGSVEPHSRKLIGEIWIGSRILVAKSQSGNIHWGPKSLYVTKDGVDWKLPGTATMGVVVKNYTKQDLLVYMGEEEAGLAKAGGTATFMGLKPGAHKFKVMSTNKRFQYSPRFLDVKKGAVTPYVLGRAPATAPSK